MGFPKNIGKCKNIASPYNKAGLLLQRVIHDVLNNNFQIQLKAL